MTSVVDLSTNYCNLAMLYCGAENEHGCESATGVDLGAVEDSVGHSMGASASIDDCFPSVTAAVAMYATQTGASEVAEAAAAKAATGASDAVDAATTGASAAADAAASGASAAEGSLQGLQGQGSR